MTDGRRGVARDESLPLPKPVGVPVRHDPGPGMSAPAARSPKPGQGGPWYWAKNEALSQLQAYFDHAAPDRPARRPGATLIAAWAVYNALAVEASKKHARVKADRGWFELYVADLARMLGLSDRSVQRQLAVLVDAGLVARQEQRAGRKNLPNRYRLLAVRGDAGVGSRRDGLSANVRAKLLGLENGGDTHVTPSSRSEPRPRSDTDVTSVGDIGVGQFEEGEDVDPSDQFGGATQGVAGSSQCRGRAREAPQAGSPRRRRGTRTDRRNDAAAASVATEAHRHGALGEERGAARPLAGDDGGVQS